MRTVITRCKLALANENRKRKGSDVSRTSTGIRELSMSYTPTVHNVSVASTVSMLQTSRILILIKHGRK